MWGDQFFGLELSLVAHFLKNLFFLELKIGIKFARKMLIFEDFEFEANDVS